MEILHRSYAGTLESSDLLVEVSPAQGRSIEAVAYSHLALPTLLSV